MFCGNCGLEIKKAGNFCPRCGNPLRSPVTAKNAAAQKPAWAPFVEQAFALVRSYFDQKDRCDESVLDPVYREMKNLYSRLLPYARQEQDRNYLHALGLLSLGMADYCLEFHEETDLAYGYAATSRGALGKELSLCPPDLGADHLQRITSSLFLATEYTAFCAYMDKKNQEAYTLSSSLPVTLTSLALKSSAMFALGEERNDPAMIRNAFPLMEQLDASINEPITGDYRQLLITFAYLAYANMLAYAPYKFPKQGFPNGFSAAIHALQRIQPLIPLARYQAIIQDSLNEISQSM